jgi:hypothetical protein
LEGLEVENVGTFYGYLVYFMVISYILWYSVIFFSALVCCTKKNLAAPLQKLLSSVHRFTENALDERQMYFESMFKPILTYL